MTKRVSRVWATPVALLIAVAVGAAVGYATGLAISIIEMQQALRKYVADRTITSERYPTEGLEVLARMNASPYPRCSEAEIAEFRRLILRSHYLKDAGRMHGDQLECSTTLPKTEIPSTQYESAFTGAFGELIYIKMDALRVGKLTPIVMRMDDAYIALDPYPREVLPSPISFTIISTHAPPGKSNYVGGDPTSIPSYLLAKDGFGHAGGYLYATLCLKRFAGCNVASISIRHVVLEQRRAIRAWTAGGGLAGVFLGLTGISFYRRKRGIEQQLRRAIRRDSLRVVYQPLVELTTRNVVGAEALVRWTDEDGLIIPPDVFIKIAEERGFVNQITKLVVRRVLADFSTYLRDHPEFHINVNVAAASDLTDPAFLPMLEGALARAQCPARSLGIEITEGATARHDVAMEAITQLRLRGHRVYVDDFGTGYSSLAYLKDLAVDGIKIDQAFTQAIGTESVTVGILPQILAMAEALKLDVVAEGVETEAQYAYYRQTAVPMIAQGWLFGRPVPQEEFLEKWLEGVPGDGSKSLRKELRSDASRSIGTQGKTLEKTYPVTLRP